jgi:hypothetical protein
MRYLVCKVDADPCPADQVASVPLLETVDFASMGITPEVLLYVFSWGFASVLLFYLLGLGVAYAVGLIKQI